MAENSVSECELCNEEYDEENRRPRCLPCSHTICSDCTNQLIVRNNKSCPYCRQKFEATSARDVGVNFGLLQALRLIRQLTEETPVTDWKVKFRKENELIANQNISFCREAQEKIDNEVKMNDAMLNCLTQENQIIKNEIMVSINNLITKNAMRLGYLKEEKKRLLNRKMILEQQQSQSEQAVRKLTEISTSENMSTIIGEIEKTNLETQKQIQKLKIEMSEEDKTKNQICEATKNMKDTVRILKETLNSRSEEDEEILPIPNACRRTMDEPVEVTIESLRRRTEPVMEFLQRGRIFARHEFHGRQRYARISVCERQRVCLHYLGEETPQHGAYILEHRDVMNLVASSSRLAFLELSNVRQEKLGRIYIRLHPRTKRADQFSLMCTGQLGPSNVDTKATRVTQKGTVYESIYFGDCGNQEGTGGTALVPNVWEADPQCERPWLAGSVGGSFTCDGESGAAQFRIFTGAVSGWQLPCIFGIVKKGLQDLREAIKDHPNIEDIVISDCGLVLEI